MKRERRNGRYGSSGKVKDLLLDRIVEERRKEVKNRKKYKLLASIMAATLMLGSISTPGYVNAASYSDSVFYESQETNDEPVIKETDTDDTTEAEDIIEPALEITVDDSAEDQNTESKDIDDTFQVDQQILYSNLQQNAGPILTVTKTGDYVKNYFTTAGGYFDFGAHYFYNIAGPSVDNKGYLSVAYCLNARRLAPTDTPFTESSLALFKNDSSPEERNSVLRGLLAIAQNGCGGLYNDLNSVYAYGQDVNPMDGGSYCGYWDENGNYRQGLMIRGSFYEMTASEARAVTQVAIHKYLSSCSCVNSAGAESDFAGLGVTSDHAEHGMAMLDAVTYLVALAKYQRDTGTSLDFGMFYEPEYTISVEYLDNGTYKPLPITYTGGTDKQGTADLKVTSSMIAGDKVTLRYTIKTNYCQIKADLPDSVPGVTYDLSSVKDIKVHDGTSKKLCLGDVHAAPDGARVVVGKGNVHSYAVSGNHAYYPIAGGSVKPQLGFSQSYTVTVPISRLSEVAQSVKIGSNRINLFTPNTQKENGNFYRSMLIFSPFKDGEINTMDQALGTCANSIKATVTATVNLTYENTAKIALNKVSANTNITSGNNCYSLAGAKYTIYTDSNCTKVANRIVRGNDGVMLEMPAENLITDVNGHFTDGDIELYAGTYYVKETSPSKGFGLCKSCPHVVTLKVGEKKTVTCNEPPVNDPADIVLRKINKNGEVVNDAASSLEGAIFEIDYYNKLYDSVDAVKNITPSRKWYIKTVKQSNGTYTASLLNSKSVISSTTAYKAPSGKSYKSDEFYQENGVRVIPLGTITIKEVEAPVGYKLEDANLSVYNAINKTSKALPDKVFFARIEDRNSTSGSIIIGGNTYNPSNIELVTAEEEIRGDFKFKKLSIDDNKPMADVEFTITDVKTKESHKFKTDKNGEYNSANDTNMWFGAGKLTAGYGKLPYGTYEISEVSCAANKDMQLIDSFEITIDEKIVNIDKHIVDLGDIYNVPKPYIRTHANDKATGNSTGVARKDAELIDLVDWHNLECNKTFTLVGILMSKTEKDEDGNPVPVKDGDGNIIMSHKTFKTPEKYKLSKYEASGNTEMLFVFNSEGMEGLHTEVFEYLYLEEDGFKKSEFNYADYENRVPYAEHTDIDDAAQEINIFEMGTVLADIKTGDHMAYPGGEVILEDTIDFDGCIKGHSYTAKGYLKQYDPKTGEYLGDVTDKDGNPISAETTFVAAKESGSVKVQFKFSGVDLKKTWVCAEEEFYEGDVLLGTHGHVEDQTVYFPMIYTEAKDKKSNSHMAFAGEDAEIVDTVFYDLIAGRNYHLVGYMIDKATGENVKDKDGNPVMEEKDFYVDYPDEESKGRLINVSGHEEINFRFDASGYENKETVCYEEVYYNGELITEHKNRKDPKQVIFYPTVSTKAKDTITEDNIGLADNMVTIVDEVSYSLLSGHSYTVEGTVMKKKTATPLLDKDGKEVVVEKTLDIPFVPSEDDPELPAIVTGVIEIEFSYDASILMGESTVCYETIKYLGEPLAIHADISSEPQQISYPLIDTRLSEKDTGKKKLDAKGEVELVDEITYVNLLPSRTYVAKSILVDKKTGKPILVDGKEVVATKEFEVMEPDGKVSVEMKLKADGLKDVTVVCYEEVYLNGKLIGQHKDINSESQSMSFVDKPIDPPHIIKTGDNTPIAIIGIICCISLVGIIYLIRRKKGVNA